MLKTKLVHPEILSALASAGHGSKVLLADGDYPVSTTTGINAKIVHLNLCAGVVDCTQILEALIETILIEGAELMDVPAGQGEPQIWQTYREILGRLDTAIALKKLERFEFYDEVAKDRTALIIQSGDLREYANLLLTIGSL